MIQIEFKKPELQDREMIDHYFRMNKNRSCEYTFANTYLWSRHYKVQFAVIEDMLVYQYTGENKHFTFPKGNRQNLKKVIDLLMQWCEENDIPFHLTLVTEEQFAEIEKLYPGQFEIEYYRDSADYVYETEKLIALSGKKYHGKKNHINKFMKTYPDWSYETITADNVEDCFTMAQEWRRQNDCDNNSDKNDEMCVTLNALRLLDELGLVGGLIRADGRVVAFSIGEPVCDDTMVVHIEKAFAEVDGAYPIINQQFLLHEASEYRYVNREEDMGEPGLRQAKLSYRPVFLVEKGIVSKKANA